MVFALVALVVKIDPLPLLMATECRFAVSWAVSIFFMLMFKKSRGLEWFGPPELRKWLVLKCMASFFFITTWWAAIRRAPMGNCIAIIYCSPIITAITSRILLDEKFTTEFPFQCMLVIAGMLLVIDPPFLRSDGDGDADDGNADYKLVFVALVLCSVVPIVTKKCKSCSWIEVEHVSACLACTTLDPSLMGITYVTTGYVPQLPAAAVLEVGLILLAACGSFVGIAMETKGYQLAEVGKATMFRYVEVPFAYVLQHFGTSTEVKPLAVLGACLILAACVVGAIGQHRRNKAAVENPEAKKVLLANGEKAAAGA